jgi:hypothetical protein
MQSNRLIVVGDYNDQRIEEIFDLSLSVPMSRYIGNALGAVFGALSFSRPEARW